MGREMITLIKGYKIMHLNMKAGLNLTLPLIAMNYHRTKVGSANYVNYHYCYRYFGVCFKTGLKKPRAIEKV